MSGSVPAFAAVLVAASLALSIHFYGLAAASAWHQRCTLSAKRVEPPGSSVVTAVFVLLVFSLHLVQAVIFGAVYAFAGVAPSVADAFITALYVQSIMSPPVDLRVAPVQAFVAVISFALSVAFLIRVQASRPETQGSLSSEPR